MFHRPCLVVFLGFGLYASAVAPSIAQQQTGGRDVVYEAARNKIGLLRFCRQASLLDPVVAGTAIHAFESGLDAFPSAAIPAVRRAGDAAEEEGAIGILGPDGKRGIAEFARQFGTSAELLCADWAEESQRNVKGRSPQRSQTLLFAAPPPRPDAYLPVSKPATPKQPALVPLPVAARPEPLPLAAATPIPAAPARSSFAPTTFDSPPECPN